MMRPAFTARDRRTLLVGVITISTLVGLARGFPAWRNWQREAQLAARVATADLARAEARVRLRRTLTDSLAARNARFLALAPALLSGETPASAGATLAGLVAGAAATAGVRLGAVQIQPSEQMSEPHADSARHTVFTHVRVHVDAIGDIRGVTQMLAHLERGPTLLAVRALSITQPDPSAPADHMETLHATFTIDGVMLTPRASRPATP